MRSDRVAQGLIALGVSGPLVLSFIVFVCSFVPVIGVFLSTLPMVVAALGDYGMTKVCGTSWASWDCVLRPLLVSTEVHGSELVHGREWTVNERWGTPGIRRVKASGWPSGTSSDRYSFGEDSYCCAVG